MLLIRSGSMTMITRTWSRPPYQGYGVPRYLWASLSMWSTAPLGRDLEHATAHLDVAR